MNEKPSPSELALAVSGENVCQVLKMLAQEQDGDYSIEEANIQPPPQTLSDMPLASSCCLGSYKSMSLPSLAIFKMSSTSRDSSLL